MKGRRMTLITEEQRRQLVTNGLTNRLLKKEGLNEHDFPPVVKLFCSWAE
jgi:hypothetical protein